MAKATNLGALAKQEREAASLTQEETAARAGVNQSNLSRAERGNTGLVQTAIKVLTKVFGYAINIEPQYPIQRFPRQVLAGIKAFEGLALHLKVLYFITYFGKGCHFTDFVREFPGLPSEDVQYLEADNFRLRLGKIDTATASAMNDLINDGIIDVKDLQAHSSEQYKERYRVFLERGDYTQEQINFAVNESPHQNRPGYQDETCWYADEDGSRVDLEDYEVWYTLELTKEGEKIWKLLPSLKEAIDRDILLSGL